MHPVINFWFLESSRRPFAFLSGLFLAFPSLWSSKSLWSRCAHKPQKVKSVDKRMCSFSTELFTCFQENSKSKAPGRWISSSGQVPGSSRCRRYHLRLYVYCSTDSHYNYEISIDTMIFSTSQPLKLTKREQFTSWASASLDDFFFNSALTQVGSESIEWMASRLFQLLSPKLWNLERDNTLSAMFDMATIDSWRISSSSKAFSPK